ncbi:UDP-glucose 4-epimerase GalE [Streptomyces sp. CRB46]|uniref:UDP-glucose 4-epimerase GalE n=1 Tax=Streptomyces sp. CRB46 TaxID=2682613 RepID=UPI0018F521B6|nr:UDP-glucose 4-epimerase GalE [Streptomyces sp. CRB46]
MRVLVTGGAGYIGSFVARTLLSRGHTVHVLDDLSTGNRSAIGETPITVGDIRDTGAVKAAMRSSRPSAVIHLAALKAVAESVADPGRYYDVNVNGTRVLLEEALNFDVTRFVFSSSCSVYGTPQTCPVDEQVVTRPESPYGETKLVGERMTRWFAQTKGMHHVSLRYFNVAGAASDASLGEFRLHESPQIFPSVIRAALQGGNVEVFGADYPTEDGTAVRDYIHVEDLAMAHVQALEAMTSPELNGAYNLGSGKPASVESIVRSLEEESGVRIDRLLRSRRPGDPAECWADATLAQRAFQWRPERELQDIVRSEWKWNSALVNGV